MKGRKDLKSSHMCSIIFIYHRKIFVNDVQYNVCGNMKRNKFSMDGVQKNVAKLNIIFKLNLITLTELHVISLGIQFLIDPMSFRNCDIHAKYSFILEHCYKIVYKFYESVSLSNKSSYSEIAYQLILCSTKKTN